MGILPRPEDVIVELATREGLQALNSEGPQTEAERREKPPETNVVRLPRDWLGPREELVPFGPRADAAAVELAGSSPAAGSTSVPPSANDFWGEQSADLQHALQGPDPSGAGAGAAGPTSPPPPQSASVRGPQATSREPGRETQPYGTFLDQAFGAPSLALRLWWQQRRLMGDRRPVAPIALAALVAAVAAIILPTGGSSRRTPQPTASTGRASSAAASLAADAARQRSQLARHRVTARRPGAGQRRTRAGGRRVHGGRHARGTSRVNVAAVARNNVQTAAPSSAVGSGNASGGGADQTQSRATAAPPASTPPASSSAASDQGSSSGGTHPYGLGGTVGPGHSPNG